MKHKMSTESELKNSKEAYCFVEPMKEKDPIFMAKLDILVFYFSLIGLYVN